MHSNKVLITGTNRGLGKYMSSYFSEKGYSVFRHKGKANHDLRIIDEINDLAQEAKSFGVNILINNAAIACPGIKFNEYSDSQIQEIIDVNLRAPIVLTLKLLPQLTDIININSMVGLEVKKYRTIYSATKWGLRGFSNSLKCELEDINILDVYPTNIETYPGRKNSMRCSHVLDKIHESFIKKDKQLIIDGRPK